MRITAIILCCCAVTHFVAAQSLPVEVMAGDKRTGVDVLWFRNFMNASNKKSPWLLFHRTRASVDYHNKTAFGVTNALSYNFKNGIGIVTATQFLQTGFVIKAGVQFARPFRNGSFFSWLVAGNNTVHHFSADWFILTRWAPKLNEKWKWYVQLELLSTLDDEQIKNLTQRFRFGLSRNKWQFGFAADLSQSGISNFTSTNNTGGFLRREF